jgi:hypothetical protein
MGLGITHSARYRTMLQLLLGCQDETIGAYEAGSDLLLGFMPLMCQDGPWSRVYNSLPFAGSDGGVVSPDPAAANRLAVAYDTITAGALSRVVIPSPLLAAQNVLPYPYQLAEETTGQFTLLDFDERELWDRIEQRAQTAIRRARRAGVKVFLGRGDRHDRDWLEQAHTDTMRGLGVEPKPARFFELLDLFPDQHQLGVATLDGERVAGMLLFQFGGTIDYFLTANTEAGRSSQAMSLLVFNALCELAAQGGRIWNWGSYMAGQESVARFKRQWGVTELPYRYLVDARLDVLERSAPELAACYPGFYTYPFRLLPSAQATST